jgi:hypothetical protein
MRQGDAIGRPKSSSEGYGNDPNLVTPSTPWRFILSKHQRKLIAALGDIILPATAEYPAPSKIGIDRFFDEWVSAPYSRQQADKTLIVEGLALIDREARRQFGAGFLRLRKRDKLKIVDGIASPCAPDRQFFIRFRYLVVGGYFTSDIGLKALGYRGNVPLQSYPGASAETRRVIDAELKRLGL